MLKNNIIYILLGFILGIVGTLINDYFREKKSKKRFKECAKIEFSDLCIKLIMLEYRLLMKLQNLSKEKVKWFNEVLDKVPDNILSKSELGFKNRLKEQYTKYKNEIKNLSQVSGGDFERALHLKKYKMKFVEQNLNLLYSFDEKTQKRTVLILSQLDSLHADIDKLEYYFDKTFDTNISNDNRKIIENDQIESYKNIAQFSNALNKNVVEVIEYLR